MQTTATEPPRHAQTADEVGRDLLSDVERGLTETEAAARLARDGPNTLRSATERSAFAILARQLASLIVVLLIAASTVAFVLGDIMEGIAILVVIVLNAVIGFMTEWKAAGALEGLRQQAVPIARVRRGGTDREVAAADLVRGDIVLLNAGDRVPADGRIAEAAQLQVDEAALTGESLPVTKSLDAVVDQHAPLGDRSNMVHLGTVVTAGRGRAIVTSTGVATEIGRIDKLLDEVTERRTPLEAKLAQLNRVLLIIVVVLCGVIVLAGWLRGNALPYMVEIGISLAIAAVPEGLLAVTTMTLALGMQRMARMNALVRRLPAVEALGSTTVICSDKTGTLTRNEMTVRALRVGDRSIEVTGTGYATKGEFRSAERQIRFDGAPDASDALVLALRIGALCNDATLDSAGGETTVLGDPTEGALIVAAEKAGLSRAELERDYPRVNEIPFNSKTKRMITVHRAPDGGAVAYAKGSPSAILAASTSVLIGGAQVPLTDDAREGVKKANEALAGGALRVLALAYKQLRAAEGQGEPELARAMTFVGLVGMIDPLRDGVRDTIATCRAAGIRTVMITGDQQVTAAEIARQLRIDIGPDGTRLKAVHARDLEGLDEKAWDAIVEQTAVFARVSPEHKLQIVEALQRKGHIVAMTGDGVNDAPALKTADIGIAMGLRGTDVAKEAADIVITDDDFATIVGAVEQGRVIVNNILRFIHFLLSTNFAEVLTVFAAIMLGWPLPLGVLQILWLNMVTDIFPALSLALEPSAPDVMRRAPRKPDEPLITLRFGWLIAWQGTLLAACTLMAFRFGLHWYGAEAPGLQHAVTIAFMTLAFAQVLHAFNSRSRKRSAFTADVFSNRWLWAAVLACVFLQVAALYVPFLRDVLQTVPLTAADWGLIGVSALAPVAVVETVKAVQRGTISGSATSSAPSSATPADRT
jgi:Ca2+-transporting ATPase